MKEYSELELKVIEAMVLEANQGDSMDIDDFLREVKEEDLKRK